MKIYILSHTRVRTHAYIQHIHVRCVCMGGCARDIVAAAGGAAAAIDVAVASLLP